MAISEEQVKHVAKLASLELSDEEITKYQKDLDEILEYINKLSEVNTENVPATSHVHGSVNVFRDDVVGESLPKDEALRNAPAKNENGFSVPKIIA